MASNGAASKRPPSTGGSSRTSSPGLPPMLSPTLPSWLDDAMPVLPKRMLSPTLPPMFDEDVSKKDAKDTKTKSKSSAAKASNGTTNGNDTPPLHHVKPKHPLSGTIQKLNGVDSKLPPKPISKQKSLIVKLRVGRKLGLVTKNKPPNKLHGLGIKSVAGDYERKSTPDDGNAKKRPRSVKLLHVKLNKWMSIAKSKKHEADQASLNGDLKLAAAISLDCVFSFIVGFDYEDRADMILRGLQKPRSFFTLVPYMSQLVKSLEHANCTQLIGLCYQIRAVIYLRIAHSYGQAMKRLQQSGETHISFDRLRPGENNTDKRETLSTLSSKYISMLEASQNDFKRGFKALPLEEVEQHFPKTWSKRSKQILETKHDGGLRPAEDPFYLPLHCFSTLQEAAAFGHCLTKEWAELNNVKCEWALVKGFE
uniref:ARAD1C38830p n=1 Tax=Blastobotrys adeninivorans TaxID=409370 RepID=A0A060T9L9_BLAAD